MGYAVDGSGCGCRTIWKVADRYTEWILQYFKALADCDAPVVKSMTILSGHRVLCES